MSAEAEDKYRLIAHVHHVSLDSVTSYLVRQGMWHTGKGAICALKQSVISLHVHHQVPPLCIFRSAITNQVHDAGRVQEQCFTQPWGDQLVLAYGLRASVLVVPDVDPLWSRVGGLCRQLFNFAVSMTYLMGFDL